MPSNETPLLRPILTRYPFLQPLPTMASIIRNHLVFGLSGREYPCRVIEFCLNDLYDHDLLTRSDYGLQIAALHDHMFRGILPGLRRFYSAYSGEHVLFLELVDDLMEMYIIAANFFDETDDEMEEMDPVEEEDLYAEPHPTNIGAFRLETQYLLGMDDLSVQARGDLDTTQSSGEATYQTRNT